MNENFKPTKIVCVGLNYKSHAIEMGKSLPEYPVLFMKPPSSIIFNEQAIILPSMSKRVDHEAELAIVIGKRCKNVKKEEAFEYIKGYTCLNDVTARDLQSIDGQWTRAKGFDTFCPIGPRIVKVDNPNNLIIECRVNGIVKQHSTTADLIFKVEDLVSFISSIMTLEENDIIATGTPAGISSINEGDVVEVEIENIGILRNFVKRI